MANILIDDIKEGNCIFNPADGCLIAMYDEDGTMLFCDNERAWFGWQIFGEWELTTMDRASRRFTDKKAFCRGNGIPLTDAEKERLATF